MSFLCSSLSTRKRCSTLFRKYRRGLWDITRTVLSVVWSFWTNLDNFSVKLPEVIMLRYSPVVGNRLCSLRYAGFFLFFFQVPSKAQTIVLKNVGRNFLLFFCRISVEWIITYVILTGVDFVVSCCRLEQSILAT